MGQVIGIQVKIKVGTQDKKPVLQHHNSQIRLGIRLELNFRARSRFTVRVRVGLGSVD